MIEHILDCLPGEGLSLFYEPDERSKGVFVTGRLDCDRNSYQIPIWSSTFPSLLYS